ncbi:hypothetical protein [Streptomyces sp. P9-A2]
MESVYTFPFFLGDRVLGPVDPLALRSHALSEEALDEAWPPPGADRTR